MYVLYTFIFVWGIYSIAGYLFILLWLGYTALVMTAFQIAIKIKILMNVFYSNECRPNSLWVEIKAFAAVVEDLIVVIPSTTT